MLWRTSTDSADTQCGYREAAAAHLEGQGSSHSTARAVPRSPFNDPMTGALLTAACRTHVLVINRRTACGCCRLGLQPSLMTSPACRHMHMISSEFRRCRLWSRFFLQCQQQIMKLSERSPHT